VCFPEEAAERITEQLTKLISLSSNKSPNRASNTSSLREPPYHLMHSLSWDEDGELDIR
jgi:hypothetical protein